MTYMRGIALLLLFTPSFVLLAQLQPGDAVVTRSIFPLLNGPLYVTAVPMNGAPPTDVYVGSGHAQFHELAATDLAAFVPLDLPQPSVLLTDTSSRQFAILPAPITGLATDGGGNLFVGIEQPSSNILKYASNGSLLASYSTLGAAPFGMDLERDQCTLLYLTRSSSPAQLLIVSQNLCKGDPPATLASIAEIYFDLVILPSGNLLLAGSGGPVEVTRSGAIVRTYTIPGVTTWRGLALGIHGSSVWVAGFATDWRLYELDLVTGAVLRTLSLPQTLTTGVAIVGGWHASDVTTAPIPSLSVLAMVILAFGISIAALLVLNRS